MMHLYLFFETFKHALTNRVLILVVMDDALVLVEQISSKSAAEVVLILVVMDDALVQYDHYTNISFDELS